MRWTVIILDIFLVIERRIRDHVRIRILNNVCKVYRVGRWFLGLWYYDFKIKGREKEGKEKGTGEKKRRGRGIDPLHVFVTLEKKIAEKRKKL